ncbi:MAG: hypothetical protein HY567_00625 [Candidatus Kerfeldbacteria bacterium]|nr:hypothetical protein [Candidatus Kerfeldbacteria bacterium]
MYLTDTPEEWRILEQPYVFLMDEANRLIRQANGSPLKDLWRGMKERAVAALAAYRSGTPYH